MIKRITVVLFLAFLAFSCSTESADLGTEDQLRVPAWAKGNFDGVHTQKPLTVSEDAIVFECMNVLYTFQPQDVAQEIVESGRYVIIATNGTQLIFNKTTKEEEINLIMDDMNLGWFVLKVE